MSLNSGLDFMSWVGVVAVLGVATSMFLADRVEADPSLEATIRSYEKAWNECDSKLLGTLLAQDFSGYAVRGGLAKGADSGVEALARQCAAGIRVKLTYQILDQQAAPDVAFVAAYATGTLTMPNNAARPNALRVTFVLQRGAAQQPWKIRHTHFSAS